MKNEDNKITEYHADGAVRAQLIRMLQDLDEFCFQHKLPYFLAVATDNSELGTKYMNRARMALPMSVRLREDKVVDYEKVYRGYATIAPERLPDIELKD